MNKDVFMDAVGYLDTDILARHLQLKEKLRSKPKSKRIIHVWRWSAIAACICLVVALGAVFIPQLLETPTIDVPPIDFEYFAGLSDMTTVATVLEYYPCLEYSSFVKINNIEICEGLYSWDSTSGIYFYLIKGVVVEDYYEKIKEGTVITIPIIANNSTVTEDGVVDHSRLYDEKELSEFLKQFDTLYVYLTTVKDNQQSVYALFDKSTKYIDSLMCPVGFPLYELLPARDGKICMNQLDEFCQSTDTHLLDHNNIMGFDRLIYDGQETAELEENIRQIYLYSKSKGD